MQVLLVEDDLSLADGLRRALEYEGFIVNHVDRGRAALQVVYAAGADSPSPDIVILDLGLPDMDGLDVLRGIRDKNHELPVLALTARASLSDKVTGLDRGADDYLGKPFEMPELVARLRVIERRLSLVKTREIRHGDIVLDTVSRRVTRNSETVELSRREYMLLKSLMENGGRVQTREHLENKLYRWGEEVASNAIEVHVHHLRKKLGPDLIKTVRGVGYTIKSQ